MGDLICPACGGTPTLCVGPLEMTGDPFDSDTVQWRARSTVWFEHQGPGGVRLECPLPLTEDERAAIREEHRRNDAALRAAVAGLSRAGFEMGNG